MRVMENLKTMRMCWSFLIVKKDYFVRHACSSPPLGTAEFEAKTKLCTGTLNWSKSESENDHKFVQS